MKNLIAIVLFFLSGFCQVWSQQLAFPTAEGYGKYTKGGLESQPAPEDTSHDGMPDEWELKNGLDPDDPEDRNHSGGGGYTMLEKYNNSIQ